MSRSASTLAVGTRTPNYTSRLLDGVAKRFAAEKLTFREFIPQAWPIIEPAAKFVSNWHIDCIAEHLEALDAGQIRRLLINMPPRYGKSSLVSVLWPVWSWTDRPWLRWVFCSYSGSLAVKHNRDRRLVIESDWYRERWGNVFSMAEDQNQKNEFQNSLRGAMVATSVGGTITGKGCSRMVIDDLINPMEAESKAVRERSVEFYKTSLTTRLDNEKEGAVVIVEQRTHRNDLSGNVLLEKEWVHLSLPALNEKHRTVVFPMSRTAKVRATGDLLWEEKHGAEDLNRQKIRMGSRAFNAQFQQSPVSDEGSLFKRSWWSYYRELPKVRRRGWFWDTAVKTREQNDFTVGLLLAECADGFYLERLVKEKMEYPDLRRTVQQEQEARPANVIVVEDKSSGQQVIQELRRYTRLPIVAFDPGEKDKVLRANLVSPTVEAGKVFLPEGQPWVADFIETLAGFPDVEHDDEVDAFTSGLLYFNGRSNGGQPQVTVV